MFGNKSASRRHFALTLASTLAMGSLPALAATGSKTGANGMNGANGQVVNNGGLIELLPGGPGTDGGAATISDIDTDPGNTIQATGGNGGNGGNGISEGTSSSGR